jgi:hypothetical protein
MLGFFLKKREQEMEKTVSSTKKETYYIMEYSVKLQFLYANTDRINYILYNGEITLLSL